MIFSEKQHQDLRTYALVLFCFFLPLNARIASWIVAAWFLLWLVSLQPLKYFRTFKRPRFFLPLVLYLYFILSLSWTTAEMPDALRLLETRLSLFVFPLLLGLGPPFRTDRPERIGRIAFLTGSALAMLTCLTLGIAAFETSGWSGLSYSALGEPLHFHPTYFALYLNFAIFWALDGVQKDQLPGGAALIFILLALGFVGLLAARMQWLILILIGAVTFLVYMKRKAMLGRGLLLASLGIVLVGALLWSVPATRQRIDRAISEWKADSATPNVRLDLWRGSLIAWKTAPVAGQGVGGAQAKLMEAYETINCRECVEEEHNAHNAYLQTLVEGGLVGLLLFLAMLFVPLFYPDLRQNAIFLLFLALFMLSIITESMLDTQRGTMFFGFFYTFLFLGSGIKGKN